MLINILSTDVHIIRLFDCLSYMLGDRDWPVITQLSRRPFVFVNGTNTSNFQLVGEFLVTQRQVDYIWLRLLAKYLDPTCMEKIRIKPKVYLDWDVRSTTKAVFQQA